MQRFICIGNLTKDPEVRMTQAGDSVCPFSIAVSRDTKDENENRETDFFDVVAWKKTAENCGKYLKREARLQSWGAFKIARGLRRTARSDTRQKSSRNRWNSSHRSRTCHSRAFRNTTRHLNRSLKKSAWTTTCRFKP